MTKNDQIRLHDSWKVPLSEEFAKAYIARLKEFLITEYMMFSQKLGSLGAAIGIQNCVSTSYCNSNSIAEN